MNHLWQVNLVMNGSDWRKLNFVAEGPEDAIKRARAWIKDDMKACPEKIEEIEIVCVVRRQEVEI